MSDRFVKSATTKTPVGHSRAELERILRRYGASAFATSSDYETGLIRVSFRVPDQPGGRATVPVQLDVNVRHVAVAIFGARGNRTADELARAERVAWRHLVLWVDAALSAATAGLQTLSEAFFAHVLTADANGQVRRMVDHLDLASGGNWRALLPSGNHREDEAP